MIPPLPVPRLEAHRQRISRQRLGILTIALALMSASLGWAEPAPAESASNDRRIVAIGDIHGAFDNFIAVLETAGLVDRRQRWSGGDAILVQTGDFIDRGADSVRVARYLERLQDQAAREGGEVVVLLGNHEVLNLIGDLRYVTRDILRAYVDERSEARHTLYCSDYSTHLRRKIALRGDQPVPTKREVMSHCQSQRVLGLLEYIDALAPDGELGRWLRTLPTAAQIGDLVFVHGGISPELAGKSIDEINRRVANQLEAFDTGREYLIERRAILPTSHIRDILTTARELADQASAEGLPPPAQLGSLLDWESSLLSSNDGPFWFRGYAKWSERKGRRALPEILEPLGARRLVVGHTVQETHDIVSRFDDQVFLIDTGMLTAYYEGRPSALEIQGDRVSALYVGEDPVILVEGN